MKKKKMFGILGTCAIIIIAAIIILSIQPSEQGEVTEMPPANSGGVPGVVPKLPDTIPADRITKNPTVNPELIPNLPVVVEGAEVVKFEKPDLTITNIQIKPSPYYLLSPYPLLSSGKIYTITVTVMNKGPGTVSGAVAVRFDYLCNSGCGPGVLGQTNNMLIVNDVGVGVEKVSSSVTITPDSTGLYKFVFKVDPDNIYQESDESDLSNVWETTLKVI